MQRILLYPSCTNPTVLPYNNSCSFSAETLLTDFLFHAMSNLYHMLGAIMHCPSQIFLSFSIFKSSLKSLFLPILHQILIVWLLRFIKITLVVHLESQFMSLEAIRKSFIYGVCTQYMHKEFWGLSTG